MDQNSLVLTGVVLIICGAIAGAIAAQKGASFGLYFLLGLILGIIGIIAALFARRPVASVQAPGWYPDPWNQQMVRYHDGRAWTGFTNQMVR